MWAMMPMFRILSIGIVRAMSVSSLPDCRDLRWQELPPVTPQLRVLSPAAYPRKADSVYRYHR
jgi:hypothetical protein